jgi:hypothetical protein
MNFPKKVTDIPGERKKKWQNKWQVISHVVTEFKHL